MKAASQTYCPGALCVCQASSRYWTLRKEVCDRHKRHAKHPCSSSFIHCTAVPFKKEVNSFSWPFLARFHRKKLEKCYGVKHSYSALAIRQTDNRSPLVSGYHGRGFGTHCYLFYRNRHGLLQIEKRVCRVSRFWCSSPYNLQNKLWFPRSRHSLRTHPFNYSQQSQLALANSKFKKNKKPTKYIHTMSQHERSCEEELYDSRDILTVLSDPYPKSGFKTHPGHIHLQNATEEIVLDECSKKVCFSPEPRSTSHNERHFFTQKSRRYRLIIIQLRIFSLFLAAILFGVLGNRAKLYRLNFRDLRFFLSPNQQTTHRLSSMWNSTFLHQKSVYYQRQAHRLTLAQLLVHAMLYRLCYINSPVPQLNFTEPTLCHSPEIRLRRELFAPWRKSLRCGNQVCNCLGPSFLKECSYDPHTLFSSISLDYEIFGTMLQERNAFDSSDELKDLINALQYTVNRWIVMSLLNARHTEGLIKGILPGMTGLGFAPYTTTIPNFSQAINHPALIEQWTAELELLLNRMGSRAQLQMFYIRHGTSNNFVKDYSLVLSSARLPAVQSLSIFTNPVGYLSLRNVCLRSQECGSFYNCPFSYTHEIFGQFPLDYFKTSIFEILSWLNTDQKAKQILIAWNFGHSTAAFPFALAQNTMTPSFLLHCARFVKLQSFRLMKKGYLFIVPLLKLLPNGFRHKNVTDYIPLPIRDDACIPWCSICYQSSAYLTFMCYSLCRTCQIFKAVLNSKEVLNYGLSDSRSLDAFYDPSLRLIRYWFNVSFGFISPGSFYNVLFCHIFTTPWLYLILFLVWVPSVLSPHPLTLVHLPRLLVYFLVYIYRSLFLYHLPNSFHLFFHHPSDDLFDFSDHIVFYMSLLLILSIEIVAAERCHSSPLRNHRVLRFPTSVFASSSFPESLVDSSCTFDNKRFNIENAKHNNCSLGFFHTTFKRLTLFKRLQRQVVVQRIHDLIAAPLKNIITRHIFHLPKPLFFVYLLSCSIVLSLSYITLHTALFFHSPSETLYGLAVALFGLYAPFWVLLGFGFFSLDQFGILRYPCVPRSAVECKKLRHHYSFSSIESAAKLMTV